MFLWAYALYLAGEKRKEETVAETRDASAKSRVGNPYAAGLRDVLVARRRRGQLQGLGAYALGIVLKELARGRAPLPTPLGPGLDDDGDEKVEEEDDARRRKGRARRGDRDLPLELVRLARFSCRRRQGRADGVASNRRGPGRAPGGH